MSNEKVSPETVELVKQQMASCHRAIYYYAWEAKIRSSWYTGIQIGILVVAFGATSASILQLLNFVHESTELWQTVLSAGVSVGVIISLTWNHASKIGKLYSTSAQCRRIGIEMDDIAHRLREYGDKQIKVEVRRIAEKLEEATYPIEEAGIGYSERRNNKANERAWALARSRVAA